MCQNNLPCSIVLPTACFPEGPSPHFTLCSFWRRRPRLEAVIIYKYISLSHNDTIVHFTSCKHMQNLNQRTRFVYSSNLQPTKALMSLRTSCKIATEPPPPPRPQTQCMFDVRLKTDNFLRRCFVIKYCGKTPLY